MIYLNGEPNGSATYSGNIGINNSYFGIGKDPARTYYFLGYLDEVRIYNKALTLGEIQKHYAAGSEEHENSAI